MNKTILRLGITTLTIAITAGLSGSVAEASHAWAKYHWNLSTEQSIATPVQLGDNLTTQVWKDNLQSASNDWNFSVIKNQVSVGMSNADCGPTLGRVEVCNGGYGENGWLGIAQVWAYRGRESHIAQSVVKLNDTYFAMPSYDSLAWRDFVMCQEVGHAFGLGHQDENFSNQNLGSCMDYTSDPDGSTNLGPLSNLQPNQHDYDMLASIYNHHNTTSTGGKGGGKPARAAVPAAVLDTPAQWGTPLTRDAQGRVSLYERDLGNGFVVLTHVLWADTTTEHSH